VKDGLTRKWNDSKGFGWAAGVLAMVSVSALVSSVAFSEAPGAAHGPQASPAAPAVKAAPPAAKPEGPQPKVVTIEEGKNVGTVVKGEAIEYAFRVRNDGKGDLVINDVKPSCGCTIGKFDKVIKPGQEGKITLTIDTKAFSGPISKTAVVLTNDPAKPQFSLSLSAYVKPYVEVVPWGFFRIQGLVGEEITSDLILGSDEPNFKPVKIEVPQSYLSATLAPATEKERVEGKGKTQWKVTLKADKTSPAGIPSGEVKVITGIAKQPELVIKVSGIINESVGILPSQVTFGTFDPKDGGITREIDVVNRNPKNGAFKVTSAEASVAGVVTEVKAQDNTKVKVVVSIDPKVIKKGPFDSWITIRTNDAVKSEIKVPLRGVSL
jgi:Protein of unknown function (DUF1573)